MGSFHFGYSSIIFFSVTVKSLFLQEFIQMKRDLQLLQEENEALRAKTKKSSVKSKKNSLPSLSTDGNTSYMRLDSGGKSRQPPSYGMLFNGKSQPIVLDFVQTNYCSLALVTFEGAFYSFICSRYMYIEPRAGMLEFYFVV